QAQRRPQEEVGLRLPDRVPLLQVLGELGVLVRAAGRVTGAEALAVGPDDDHLHRVVAIGEGERLVEGVDHLRGLAVGPSGVVEHEVGDRAVDLVDEWAELLTFHGRSLPQAGARPPGGTSGTLSLRTSPGVVVAPGPPRRE